jgi:hypothetical protein
VADAVALYKRQRRSPSPARDGDDARAGEARALPRPGMPFEEQVALELERVARGEGVLTLIVAEDARIEEVGPLLPLRQSDLVGRVGHRLVVLMPGTSRSGATRAAGRLAAALAGARFGVAEAPADGDTIDSLVAAALTTLR